MNPTTSINQQTQPEKQHFADRHPKLGVPGAPGSPRQAQGCPGESPGRAQRSSSRGCLREAKKAQGAPGARNGQFAKENVIEKQHFGDRLQKLGFWGPDLASKEPQELTCHFDDPLWNSRDIDRQKHWRIAHSTTRVLEKGSNLVFTNSQMRQEV